MIMHFIWVICKWISKLLFNWNSKIPSLDFSINRYIYTYNNYLYTAVEKHCPRIPFPSSRPVMQFSNIFTHRWSIIPWLSLPLHTVNLFSDTCTLTTGNLEDFEGQYDIKWDREKPPLGLNALNVPSTAKVLTSAVFAYILNPDISTKDKIFIYLSKLRPKKGLLIQFGKFSR